MHIVIAGVHFNQHAISLPKLADWGPARSQPVALIQDNPMKYARAPKFRTIGFLMVELLVESLRWSRSRLFSMGYYEEWLDGMPSSRKKYRNGDVELTQ